jgi:hypothetical protein
MGLIARRLTWISFLFVFHISALSASTFFFIRPSKRRRFTHYLELLRNFNCGINAFEDFNFSAVIRKAIKSVFVVCNFPCETCISALTRGRSTYATRLLMPLEDFNVSFGIIAKLVLLSSVIIASSKDRPFWEMNCLAHSKVGVFDSNPTLGTYVCVRLICLCCPLCR